MRRLKTLPNLATLLMLTCCSSPPPSLAPPPPLVTAPPPSPTPTSAMDWQDAPLTSGMWTYQRLDTGSRAVFEVAGVQSTAGPPFVLICGRATRQIGLSARFAIAGSMIIRTSFGEVTVPTTQIGGPENHRVIGTLAATDPILDQMAYSRGRFLIAVEGGETLILPAWPEIARVVEDCRR